MERGYRHLAYKKLGWRKAAIIMDDYSFGWTSGAGLIADFCGVGGKIAKRVFPPLNTTDYAPYIQQLPAPSQVDGYFWIVGGTGTGPSLKAYESAYGKAAPKKFVGNLFFFFQSGFADVAPRLIGSYYGGFGNAPRLKTRQAKQYEATVKKWYGPAGFDVTDSFVYNYYNAAHALVIGLNVRWRSWGEAAFVAAEVNQAGYQVSNRGQVKPTRTVSRSPTSTRSRSSRARTASLLPWSSHTCRASTSRSAASSRRRPRRLAAASRPA